MPVHVPDKHCVNKTVLHIARCELTVQQEAAEVKVLQQPVKGFINFANFGRKNDLAEEIKGFKTPLFDIGTLSVVLGYSQRFQ